MFSGNYLLESVSHIPQLKKVGVMFEQTNQQKTQNSNKNHSFFW